MAGRPVKRCLFPEESPREIESVGSSRNSAFARVLKKCRTQAVASEFHYTSLLSDEAKTPDSSPPPSPYSPLSPLSPDSPLSPFTPLAFDAGDTDATAIAEVPHNHFYTSPPETPSCALSDLSLSSPLAYDLQPTFSIFDVDQFYKPDCSRRIDFPAPNSSIFTSEMTLHPSRPSPIQVSILRDIPQPTVSTLKWELNDYGWQFVGIEKR